MPPHYKAEVSVHKIPMRPYGNNGYVIVCPQTDESIVIDTPAEPGKLIAVARHTAVKAILITHTHMDHLVGFEKIRSALGAPVGVHATEGKKRRFVAVPHQGPVDSPEKAVWAAIIQEQRGANATEI